MRARPGASGHHTRRLLDAHDNANRESLSGLRTM